MRELPAGFGKALWFVGAVTALLTAIYMTRLMVMTFWSNERFREKSVDHEHGAHHHDVAHEPHESPWSMTIPLIVLAILSTVGGLVGVPYALSSLTGGHPENYFEHTLEPVISPHRRDRNRGLSLKLHWQSPPPQEIDGKPAFGPSREAPQLSPCRAPAS